MSISKRTFSLSVEPIDVVIPCAEKDKVTLDLCIEGIRKNGQNIRRIIVVSKEALTEKAEWFDEAKYPFSKRDLAFEIFQENVLAAEEFLNSPKSRAGWIFQQFVKLYAPFVIPNISSNVLILDADVIFLNSTSFMTEKGEPLFNTGSELHLPYFRHMEKLLPGLHRVYQKYSGICHYMLFQKPILEDFFTCIEKQHPGKKSWQAICQLIDQKEIFKSCLSEYEMYFNFALLRTAQAKVRCLKWIQLGTWEKAEEFRENGFSYMACQEWIRRSFPTMVDVHLPSKELVFRQ